MSHPTWYRGESIDYVLTVTTDDVADNLDTVEEIELRVKETPGEDDDEPLLVSVKMTAGEIVRRTQSGANVGVADIRIPSDALTGDATPAGDYYYAVKLKWPDDGLGNDVIRYVVKPTRVRVRDAV